MQSRDHGTSPGRVAAAAVGFGVLLGCAPMQPVTLDLAPEPVAVYVDGRPARVTPGDEVGRQRVALRSDVSHVLYFKREGYRPERVVLETRRVDGESRLEPGTVVVRLDPLTSVQRALSVELEPADPDEATD
jgi:hypothetical protein